jgi:methyl-accepting chemotaxis protein
MLASLKRVFAPPVFEDEGKTRVASLLNVILWTFIVLLSARFVTFFFTLSDQIVLVSVVLGSLIGTYVGLLFLMRAGRVRAASIAFTGTMWIAITLLLFRAGGIRGTMYSAYTLVILVTGLLLGGWAAIGYAGASVVVGTVVFVLESRGIISLAMDSSLDFVFTNITPRFISVAVLVYLYHRGFNKALAHARRNEHDLAESNKVLDAIRTSLQERNEHLQSTVQEYDEFMSAVGQGKLADRLSLNGDGRRGDDPLVKLGHRLNETVASLGDMIAQIRDAATALSAQTSEILATTTQQASGATEQSAAISQATTTVDEIRTIAEQLVNRSQTVADVAQRTVEVSRTGQETSRETIAGMAQIKARVDVIEENILALSERTQQIGAIIDTVEAIASQSNMLALNASVEAARAGEQGKGFAVVAQEVRDLADRSREATAQVKAILSDVQKATASTAMATEEGKKGVDAGVELVSRMRDAIEQLSAVIGESAQSATQMVAGGQQQTSGMEQIAMAMQNINQVTVQSLSSTRQAEQSAQELNDLARSLTEIVQQYQV